jgi:uncharacterized protein
VAEYDPAELRQQIRQIVQEEARGEGGGGVRDEIRQLVQDETMGIGETPPQAPPIADPTPLAVASFSLTNFLLSCVNAGWLAQIGTVIPMALFYGGLAQFVAGVWEFRNNNTFGAVVFCSFGAFWGGTGFFFFFTPTLGVASTANQLPAVGFTLVGWTVFSLYMWVASAKVNKTVFIIFALLVLTLILLDIGFLAPAPSLIVVGGYTGILISIAGWYLSAAGVMNHVFGRVVMPIGSPFGEGS